MDDRIPFPLLSLPQKPQAIMATEKRSDELSPDHKDPDVAELASTEDQDELQLVIRRFLLHHVCFVVCSGLTVKTHTMG